MDERTIARRVEILDRKMETLQGLPTRVAAVEVQILQLRTEMHGEFSLLRAEMRRMHDELIGSIGKGDEETRSSLIGAIQAGDEETRQVLREEIQAGDEETRRVLAAEIRAGDEETRQVLRVEIQAGDEETRRLMRVLHEDVVGRLALIQESQGSRRTKGG